MRRMMAVIALFIIAADCIAMATGAEPQRLMSADYLWTWWVAAAGWVFWAIVIWKYGAP